MACNPLADWEALTDSIRGSGHQAGEDNRSVKRVFSLVAGLRIGMPGFAVNHLCDLGMDALGSAALAIWPGEARPMIGGRGGPHDPRALCVPKAESAFSRCSAVHDVDFGPATAENAASVLPHQTSGAGPLGAGLVAEGSGNAAEWLLPRRDRNDDGAAEEGRRGPRRQVRVAV